MEEFIVPQNIEEVGRETNFCPKEIRSDHSVKLEINSATIKKNRTSKIIHETCQVCDCRFDPKLKEHGRNRRIYVCGLCHKSFCTAKELKRHFNGHLHEYPFTCNICKQGFQRSGSLNIHKRTIHGNGPVTLNQQNFQCNICAKRFNSRSNLSSHQRVHSDKRPFHCADCTRSFKSKFELKSHRLIHSNEKPYVCQVCHKAFRQSGNLNSHLRVHNQEKPFLCNICGKAFRESSKLTRHYRLHTKEKPYGCTECGRDFRDLSNMKKHMRIHYKEPSAGRRRNFKRQTVNNHATPQIEENTYICNICSKAFHNLVTAQEHVKSHNEEENEELVELVESHEILQ